MKRPLKAELYKYRKRKKLSINRKTAGFGYQSFSYARPAGSRRYHRTGRGHSFRNNYLGPLPRTYHPRLNSPNVQTFDYEPEENQFYIPSSRNNPSENRFGFQQGGEFENIVEDKQVDYETSRPNSQALQEMLDKIWGDLKGFDEFALANDAFESEDSFSSDTETGDNLPEFADMVDALAVLKDNLPEGHPDIASLEGAIHQWLQTPELHPQPEDFAVEDTVSKLGTGNPYENDRLWEDDSPGDGFSEIPEDDFQGCKQDLDSDFDFQGDSLEDIVQAQQGLQPETVPDGINQISDELNPQPVDTEISGYDTGMQDMQPAAEFNHPGFGQPSQYQAVDPQQQFEDNNAVADNIDARQEIDEAINQVTQPQEDDQQFDPFAVDPYMTAQQLFEQQLQYFNNPMQMPAGLQMPGPPGP
jgi:hypothetical protein